jgi:hypothetical protein
VALIAQKACPRIASLAIDLNILWQSSINALETAFVALFDFLVRNERMVLLDRPYWSRGMKKDFARFLRHDHGLNRPKPRPTTESAVSIYAAATTPDLHDADYMSRNMSNREYRLRFESRKTAVAFAAMTLVLGCKSAPAPTPAPVQPVVAKSAYPPRPTIPPPPFRVFHTTDNSITLVTVPNATDDQMAAILYQLHDAAHNHSFAALHISQQFVDKRDPMIWFHIYRGPKCADEKYTTDALPCGPSYHAAGDYTLGSFSNKNRDEGALLHGEDHQTELWNPDTPTT